MNVYEVITRRIIERLDAGAVSSRHPWAGVVTPVVFRRVYFADGWSESEEQALEANEAVYDERI
jgi:hypothetical protein